MRDDDNGVTRLGEDRENPSSLQARAGAFLCEARPTVGLTDVEIDAIERRLLHRDRARQCRNLVPVLAALAALLACGSVMAIVGGWRLPFQERATWAPTAVQPTQGRPSRKSAVGPASAPVAHESRLPPAASATPEAQAPVVARRAVRQEPPLPPSATLAEREPREAPLSAEAQSLAEALARWRRDGDAEAALGLLAAHERRFAHGTLAVESRVARAEILLTLGRRAQALGVLDSLSLAGLPRGRELQTIRGELRIEVSRCQEARPDLSRVLLESTADDLGQRALRALAKCP